MWNRKLWSANVNGEVRAPLHNKRTNENNKHRIEKYIGNSDGTQRINWSVKSKRVRSTGVRRAVHQDGGQGDCGFGGNLDHCKFLRLSITINNFSIFISVDPARNNPSKSSVLWKPQWFLIFDTFSWNSSHISLRKPKAGIIFITNFVLLLSVRC